MLFWLICLLCSVRGLQAQQAFKAGDNRLPENSVFANTAVADDDDVGEDVTMVRVSGSPKKLILKPKGMYRLTVDRLDKGTKFVIFEAHALRQNLLLSPSTTRIEAVNSTSPALFMTAELVSDLGGAILYNPHLTNLTALVFAREYGKLSPVPGICNTEPGIQIKPYLEVSWTKSLVNLRFRQAGRLQSCKNLDAFRYNVYQYFLSENDCSESAFMEGYKSMVDPADLTVNGQLLATLTHRHTSINLTNYPRTGRVIAVVVSWKNESSIYGLAHTFGCNTDPGTENGCEDPDSTFVWVACALGVFVGAFLALGGHRYFKCSQFLFGFYAGSLAGYILVSLYTDNSQTLLILLTSTSGLIVAVFVLALWWFLGIPVLSVILPTLQTGVILASLLMYLPLCGLEAFFSDTTFWLVFTCISLSPTLLFIAFTQKASIISCVVLGSFTFGLSVDRYTGSNLRFVLGNVINRILVDDFGKSYRCPPFQRMDLILVTCFVGGIAVGLICQLIVERRKPPFPPAPYQQWRWVRSYNQDGEGAPLVPDDLSEEPPVRAAAVVGFISGRTVADHAALGSSSNMTTEARPRSKQNFGATSPPLQGGASSQRRDIFSPTVATER